MANMSQLMQQAQKMQEKMKEIQETLEKAEFTGQSGGGLVNVIINGKYSVKAMEIDPSLMSEDKEVVEDLVAAAFNDAVCKVEEGSKQGLSGLADGFGLPPGFKMPF